MALNKNRIINKYKNKPLKEGFVFVDSMLSSKLNGELFFAVKRILETTDLTVVISTKEKKVVKKSLESFDYENRLIFTNRNKLSYIKYLSTCKFLLNDVSFPKYFNKRNDQIYFNTWHGTPIKTLGIDIKKSNFKVISNVHKNFNDADRIVVNSEFLKDILYEKYLLPPTKNKFLLSPYLKLSSLKDGDVLKTSSKSVLFMYTWRSGNLNSKKMVEKLIYIDTLLQNDKRIKKGDKFNYVYHHLNKTSLSKFWVNLKLKRKLKVLTPLNDEITANQAIYMHDTLVTDYSSVMFDAAYLNKNLVLDWSSFNEYKKERGLYEEVITDIPYKKHFKIYEAINSIWNNNIISEELLKKFNEKYSTLDNSFDIENTWVENFLNFENDGSSLAIENLIDNENTNDWNLIYPGTMAMNGMTTSAIATVERLLNLNEKIIFWIPNQYIKTFKSLKNFGIENEDNVRFITSSPTKPSGFFQKISMFFLKKNWYVPNFLSKKIDEYFENEKNKIFGSKKFKNVIHFSGYEYYVAEVLNKFENVNRIIYVHNDMYLEYKNKKNYKKHSIYKAYDNFEKIIFVSEYLMKKSIEEYKFFMNNKDRIFFINNPISKKIYNLQDSEKRIPSCIDKKRSYEIMISKILDKNSFNIINIGRYSKEKNQKLLLKQFTKFKNSHPSDKIILLLVGSSKKLNLAYYNKITKMIKNNKFSDDIYQFENINVFTLLRHSDVFALTSTHEAFPMVNLEANLMGLHVISSNLPGNIEQYEKYSIGQNFNLQKKDDLLDKFEFTYEHFIQKKLVRIEKMNIDQYNEIIEKQIVETLFGLK